MGKRTDVAAKQFHLSNLIKYILLIGLAIGIIVNAKDVPVLENFHNGFKAVITAMPIEYNAVSYNLVKKSVKRNEKEIQIFIGCSTKNIDALDCTTMELYVAYLLLKPYKEDINEYKDWKLSFYTYYTDTPTIIPSENDVTPYSVTVEQFLQLGMLDKELSNIKDFSIVVTDTVDDSTLSITNNYNIVYK